MQFSQVVLAQTGKAEIRQFVDSSTITNHNSFRYWCVRGVVLGMKRKGRFRCRSITQETSAQRQHTHCQADVHVYDNVP